jgi:hypothetical protein
MPCPSQFTLCREKWADMTPTESGRLCARCDRELIDFTEMSEPEIRAYHAASPGTCGLYSLSQFHKPGSRLAAAAAAVAIGLIPPTAAHAVLQTPVTGDRPSVVEPVDSILVAGTVVDAATNRPVHGAQVMAAGTMVGSLTDQNGQFRFFLRTPVPLPLHLRAQLIGYATEDAYVTATDSLGTVNFAMSQVMIGIVGIIVVGEQRPPAPRAKPSFWRRLWRALGGN